MAHFARLDESNIVTMVTVVSNADMIDENGEEQEALGVGVCESVIGPGPWVQTSYNGNIRQRYAAIGGCYDADNDRFLDVRPYPSWQANESGEWQAPVPPPNDGKLYEWDEDNQGWKQIEATVPEDQQTAVEQLP